MKKQLQVGDKVKVLVKNKYWFRGEVVSIIGDKVNVLVVVGEKNMIVESNINEVYELKEVM